MGAVVKGYNVLLHGLAVCSGIVIFAAFLLIVFDVTIRIMGFAPPAFTIAVVEYILLYFTIMAAPWLVRIKGHVFIDAVTQFLPPIVKRVTAKIVYLICICSALVFCYFSWHLFYDAVTFGTLDIRGVDMPQWSLYAPLPIGFLLVAIEFMRYLIGIDDMYSVSLDTHEGM